MKKVGILTHFYKSNNYGGVLQAYALVNCINKSGIIAEQINYCSRYLKKNNIYTKLKSNLDKKRNRS